MGILNRIFFTARRLKKKYSLSPYGWKGNFPDWQTAEKKCRGYGATNILEKVSEATRLVLSGKAFYERDSVLFHEPSYSYPLLSYLFFAHLQVGNRLSVIDFGGSLGSTYLQHRKLLSRSPNLTWAIVEQSGFVQRGKEIYKDGNITFHHSIEELVATQGQPDLVLLSSTLPYLSSPYDLLGHIIAKKIRFIVIDDTPFNFNEQDRITIQTVNPLIYEASYPCWFLSLEKVKRTLKQDYNIVAEHHNEATIYLDGRAIRYRGLLAELKQL